MNFLLEKGFKQSGKEPCLLYKISESEFTLLTMIVDDVLLATVKTSHTDEIVQQLSKNSGQRTWANPNMLWECTSTMIRINKNCYSVKNYTSRPQPKRMDSRIPNQSRRRQTRAVISRKIWAQKNAKGITVRWWDH